jgi:GntR family transcriptional regulator, arabinose operon transcriptional repressor
MPRPPPARVPYHRIVYSTLLREIQAGTYPVGGKLPGQDAMARQFGVSRPTIIRALQDLIAEGHVYARQGSGIFVSQPAAGKVQVGLIVPGVLHHEQESIFSLLAQQIAREASRIGWHITQGISPHSKEDVAKNRPVELVRQMIAQQIRGAIYVPHASAGQGDAFNRNVLSELMEAGIPVVLQDRDIFPGTERSNYDLISMDHVHAGEIVGRHLAQAGCRRAVFLTWSSFVPSQRQRFQGLCLAFERAGLAAPSFVHCEGSFDLAFVSDLLVKKNPDSIVCQHDQPAVVLMGHLQRLKWNVPDRIKVVGFDDAPISRLSPIPLTTVAQPVDALAFKVVEALRDRMERKNLPFCSVTVRGQLCERRSTQHRSKAAAS